VKATRPRRRVVRSRIKLFDEDGEPLLVQGAAKGRRRYRYYVSRKLVHAAAPEDAEHGSRLSAPEIERSVSTAARGMLGDRNEIARACEEADIDAERLPSILRATQNWIGRLRAESEVVSALAELVERVVLSRDGMEVTLKLPLLSTSDHSGVNPSHLSLARFVPLQMKRRGVELRLVLEGGSGPSRIDLPMLRAVARARRWSDELISGQARSVDEIARREGLDRRSVRRLLPLGFLSPRVVEAIVEGRQPPDLSVMALTRRIDLPLLWSAQEQALGLR
jgi:site-specific DNA recombinase